MQNASRWGNMAVVHSRTSLGLVKLKDCSQGAPYAMWLHLLFCNSALSKYIKGVELFALITLYECDKLILKVTASNRPSLVYDDSSASDSTNCRNPRTVGTSGRVPAGD